MTQERHEQMCRIYSRARELAPERWLDVVRAAAGGDSDLEQQVMALLRVQTDGLLAVPALGADFRVSADPQLELMRLVPARIASYTILRPLGAGGAGVVFLAQQDRPLDRYVAIKVLDIRRRSVASLARFESECATLARLKHPFIASVYEAGRLADGRPYMVMEYIDGLPITEFCAESTLDRGARVELIRKVAQAIHYAHQSRVLHRDLKPENVLVTRVNGEPMPKLIDFGIAKLLDSPEGDARLTADGLFLGTLAYASPEQLDPLVSSGRSLDARTDVYGLGVLLLELVTGRLPTAIATHAPAIPLEAVFNGRLRESAAAAAGLRGDLAAIIRRATARHPEDRYTSAQDLAEDLERLARNMPVRAGRTGMFLRLQRGAVRHRRVLRITVPITMALVVAVGWALHQRAAFIEHHGITRQAIETAAARIATIVRTQGGALNSHRAVLEGFEAQVNDALRRFPGDAAVIRTRALLDETLGDCDLETGKTQSALRRYQSSTDHWTALLQLLPRDRAARRSHAISLVHLGDLKSMGAQYAEKLALYEAAHAALLDLADDSRATATNYSDLGNSHGRLAHLLSARGETTAAADHRHRQLELAERVLRLEPDSALRWYELALAHLVQADHADAWNEQPVKAEHVLAALSLLRGALQLDPENRVYRRTYCNALCCDILVHLTNQAWEEARAGCEALSREADMVAAADPESAFSFEALGRSHERWAQYYSHRSEPGKAEASYRQAIDYFERHLALTPNDLSLQSRLASAMHACAEINPGGEGALSLWQRAESLLRSCIASEDVQRPLDLARLAQMLLTPPDLNLCRPQEAVALARRAADATEYQSAGTILLLARAYASAGDLDAAAAYGDMALALLPAGATEKRDEMHAVLGALVGRRAGGRVAE